jgi:hypothetical protein
MSATPKSAFPIVPPELRDVLQAFRREIFSSLKCAIPGIIQSFDEAKQSATIQVAMQATVGDKVVDYPLLVDCPVVVLGGGGGVLTFPIQAGDTCIVLFTDRALDNWYSTGNVVPPAQQRAHSLSDGIALVGIRNLANPIKDYSTTGAEFRLAGGKVRITDSGQVILSSSGGVTIDLNEMVSLANDTTSLKTILDELVTNLTNWLDTRGDLPNPATVAALAATKVKIDELFV